MPLRQDKEKPIAVGYIDLEGGWADREEQRLAIEQACAARGLDLVEHVVGGQGGSRSRMPLDDALRALGAAEGPGPRFLVVSAAAAASLGELLDEHSRRTREGLAVARGQGRQLGRPRLVGTAVLAELVDAYQGGRSCAAIARDLDDAGVPAPAGGRWQPRTVSRLVARELRVSELPRYRPKPRVGARRRTG
jgi:hypothetical protein